MINYAVVEEIVLEVLKNLEEPTQISKTDKTRLLVINAPEVMSLQHLEADWDVINKFEKSQEHADEQVDAEKAIIFNLSQDLLVKGALGITDTFESKLLAELLTKGVAVELIPAPELAWLADKKVDYQASEYIKHLLTYKRKLESFGVKLIPFSESILSVKVGHIAKETFSEKLLTKDYVDKLTEQQITISKSTIVTPLAYDRARELGKSISIIE